jgi:predicted P-loop ATPase
MNRFETNRDGSVKTNLRNLSMIVDGLADLWPMYYDAFSRNVVIEFPASMTSSHVMGEYTSLDWYNIIKYIHTHTGAAFRKTKIAQALRYKAMEKKINTFDGFVSGLPVWDGIDRLGGWAQPPAIDQSNVAMAKGIEPVPGIAHYIGAENTYRNNTLLRKWLVCAADRIARYRESGCIILCGPDEETAKDVLRLFAGPGWYHLDDGKGRTERKAYVGAWIVDLGNRVGVTQKKLWGMYSAARESAAYVGRHYHEERRRCVFAGTYKGSFRGMKSVWPVDIIGAPDFVWLQANIAQIWAQVFHIRQTEDAYVSESFVQA